MSGIVKLLARLGENIFKASKDRTTAILLIILSVFSPVGFIIAASLIAYAYKGRKSGTKRKKR